MRFGHVQPQGGRTRTLSHVQWSIIGIAVLFFLFVPGIDFLKGTHLKSEQTMTSWRSLCLPTGSPGSRIFEGKFGHLELDTRPLRAILSQDIGHSYPVVTMCAACVPPYNPSKEKKPA